MNLLTTFPIALRALWKNRMRSVLTALGVVIGIASVVSMVAVGEGAKASVEKVFTSMGTNLLVVLSGSTSGGGVMGGYGSMPTLTWEDLEAIRRDAPSVAAAAPVLNARVTMVADEGNWTAPVSGTSPELLNIRAWSLAKGSFFGQAEITSSAKVIVLGQTTSDKLFGSGVNPVGRTVRLRGVGFLVIGLLERKGQSPMGQDYDDTALIPYTSFQTKLQGGPQKYIPGAIMVSARSSAETTRAKNQITSILRDRHHLASSADDDFNVRNLAEVASAQQQGTKTLTALLAAIAVVSLVVGGIGIMNIMLVSVTERTREIGVRMAVGAKPWHVLAQFLVEALTLSLIGGAIGLGIGFAAGRILTSELGWEYSLRTDTALVAFGVSAFVGVAFGFFPARRAALLDPIEALRAE